MKKLSMLMMVLCAIGAFEAQAKAPVKKKAPVKIKNLQRVTFYNKSENDIVVMLRWDVDKGSKRWAFGFSEEEEHILKAHHKEKVFQAPFSEYHLGYVEVTPAANLAGKDLAKITINSAAFANELMSNQSEEERLRNRQRTHVASGVTEIAYAISRSLNNDHVNVPQDKTFFVVEYSHEKSSMPGQKQIKIKDYKNKEHYEAEISKIKGNNPVYVAQDNSSTSHVNIQSELQKIELEEKRIALEEKRLALKERELALEIKSSSHPLQEVVSIEQEMVPAA